MLTKNESEGQSQPVALAVPIIAMDVLAGNRLLRDSPSLGATIAGACIRAER